MTLVLENFAHFAFRIKVTGYDIKKVDKTASREWAEIHTMCAFLHIPEKRSLPYHELHWLVQWACVLRYL